MIAVIVVLVLVLVILVLALTAISCSHKLNIDTNNSSNKSSGGGSSSSITTPATVATINTEKVIMEVEMVIRAGLLPMLVLIKNC